MKITISRHAVERAIERFPALNIPIKEINAILYAIAHRGQPIRSMRFGERYQVGVLTDGSPIILAMKEGLADQWTVTTVMHDRQVIPHAILGETAKAVEAARALATPHQTTTKRYACLRQEVATRAANATAAAILRQS